MGGAKVKCVPPHKNTRKTEPGYNRLYSEQVKVFSYMEGNPAVQEVELNHLPLLRLHHHVHLHKGTVYQEYKF